MKKSSLISLLPQILLNHKEWFESKGNRGIFADLSEEYLREGNFQNAVLVEANFQGADLRGAYFENADLRGANLQDVQLNGAHLKNANFEVTLDSRTLDEKENVNNGRTYTVKCMHLPRKKKKISFYV